MPEGDTIRCLSDSTRRRYLNQTLVRSEFRHSRYATTDLSGHRLIDTDARGKNLLLRFDSEITIHLHLKLQGTVRYGRDNRTPIWRR